MIWRWKPPAASATRPSTAPVAQLDRALPSEGRGHRFESCRVRHSRSVLGTRFGAFPDAACRCPPRRRRPALCCGCRRRRRRWFGNAVLKCTPVLPWHPGVRAAGPREQDLRRPGNGPREMSSQTARPTRHRGLVTLKVKHTFKRSQSSPLRPFRIVHDITTPLMVRLAKRSDRGRRK